MNIMFFIGASAMTHGLKEACRAQARDYVSLGMAPLAVVAEVMTECAFAPVIAWQDEVTRALKRGIEAGN